MTPDTILCAETALKSSLDILKILFFRLKDKNIPLPL
jgi:hypothetical protein